MSTRRFLISNYPTWYFSNKKFIFNLEDSFFTEDPYTYERLVNEGFKVSVPSTCMKENKIVDEEMSYKAAHFIKDRLNCEGGQPKDGIAWGNVLNLNMAFFINTVVTRARELEYVLDGGKVIIPYLSKDDENNLDGNVGRLTFIRRNYYALLSDYICGVGSDYKNRVELSKLNYSYSDYVPDKRGNVSVKEKIYYRVLSLLSGDVNVFERLVFKYIRLNGGRIFNKGVYITGDNRMISSLVIPLIMRFNIPSYVNVKFGNEWKRGGRPVYRFQNDVFGWINNNSSSEIQEMSLRMALLFIENYVHKLSFLNDKVSSFVESVKDKSEKIIFLTNTPHAAFDSLLYENIKNNNAIKMVAFTDGNVGINSGDLLTLKFAVRGMCDGYVAHSEYEEELFKKITSDTSKKFYAYNFTHYQKSRLSVLIKLLYTGLLFGKGKYEKYIIYAPTRFKEDHRFIKGDFSDIEYWSFVSKLVRVLERNSDAKIIVKTYGKEVYPGQMRSYIGDPEHPLQLRKCSENIIIRSYPRLNYMIHAADIVIIDRATSTLQTCLISNKIIIFVHNGSHQISDNVLRLLCDSIFVIDGYSPDWEDELEALLSCSMREVYYMWNLKEKRRSELCDRYVLGVNSSKNDLIDWIDQL